MPTPKFLHYIVTKRVENGQSADGLGQVNSYLSPGYCIQRERVRNKFDPCLQGRKGMTYSSCVFRKNV